MDQCITSLIKVGKKKDENKMEGTLGITTNCLFKESLARTVRPLALREG